jgi:hypothetical protein
MNLPVWIYCLACRASSRRVPAGEAADGAGAEAAGGRGCPIQEVPPGKVALIKKKIKFSSHIGNSEWSSCKVMRKGFLIYEEMRKYLAIYEEAISHI